MPASTSDRLRTAATEMGRLLAALTIPSLAATADYVDGGYRIEDNNGRFLVAQARLTWLLSHGARVSTAATEQAARNGFRFLLDKQRDAENGGFYWSVDSAGRSLDDRKFLYGQAFAIFALVEFARSFDRSALAAAMEAFELINSRARDQVSGGWLEHFHRHWEPLDSQERVPLERPGWKSSNAHLHWMEALIELHRETADRSVGAALEEALEINETRFFPSVRRSISFSSPDWSEHAKGDISYGHIVEFAWMRLAARTALGKSPGWDEFDRVIEQIGRMGAARDGSLHDGPRTSDFFRRRPRQWWVQAEWLVALTTAARKHPDDTSLRHQLANLADSLIETWIDKRDGLWFPRLDHHGHAAGRKFDRCWKAGYHEVRAMRIFSQAFAGDGSTLEIDQQVRPRSE